MIRAALAAAGLLLASGSALGEGAGESCCNGLELGQGARITRSAREVERVRRRALADSRITLEEESRIRSEERRHSRLRARIRRH